jgi:WD40 repeat protein
MYCKFVFQPADSCKRVGSKYEIMRRTFVFVFWAATVLVETGAHWAFSADEVELPRLVFRGEKKHGALAIARAQIQADAGMAASMGNDVVSTGRAMSLQALTEDQGHFGRDIRFSPDGKHLLLGYGDGIALLLDTANWTTVRAFDANAPYKAEDGSYRENFVPSAVGVAMFVPTTPLKILTVLDGFTLQPHAKTVIRASPANESEILWDLEGRSVWRISRTWMETHFPSTVAITHDAKYLVRRSLFSPKLEVREFATGRTTDEVCFTRHITCLAVVPGEHDVVIGLSSSNVCGVRQFVEFLQMAISKTPGTPVEMETVRDFARENVATYSQRWPLPITRNIGLPLTPVVLLPRPNERTCVVVSHVSAAVWHIETDAVQLHFWTGDTLAKCGVERCSTLVIAGDASLRIFDSRTGACRGVFRVTGMRYPPSSPRRITAIDLDQTGALLGVLYADGLLEVWQLGNLCPDKTFSFVLRGDKDDSPDD